MKPVKFDLISETSSFGGRQCFYKHVSSECGGTMKFGLYTPPQARERRVPAVIFLAGLTCNEETFAMKAGAQRLAAELGLMLVTPDTSPRESRFEGDAASWDFGLGAGFYLDATRKPWSQAYRLYSYVTRELIELLTMNFPCDPDSVGIMGHSMGGHGALVCALKNPRLFRSVSAFAPICRPAKVPWGKKAFTQYLGDDPVAWDEWDATALVRHNRVSCTILIDQGLSDKFLAAQLTPNVFEQACQASGQPLELRLIEGYDHSYYFISTFVEDHLRHHASYLLGG